MVGKGRTARGDKRLAILVSGDGTTAQAIIDAAKLGELDGIAPVVVIGSRQGIGGLRRAEDLGVPSEALQHELFGNDSEAFGTALLEVLHEYDVDLVSQNGWLVKTPAAVVREFEGRIINQHPGQLDPGRIDFGGKGMYGRRVVCARLIYAGLRKEERPETEATTHYVAEEYDQGDVISVRPFALPPSLDFGKSRDIRHNPILCHRIRTLTDEVQRELLPIEHINVVTTLRMFATTDRPVLARHESLFPSADEELIKIAKTLAIQLFPKG